MNARDLTSEGRLLAGALAGFALVAVLAVIDIAADLREGTTSVHVAIEGSVVVVALLCATLLGRRLAADLRAASEARREAASLAERLEHTEREAARYREEARDLLRGLGAVLDSQFERWALSAAEKEVALLLLKGLSHKEIAQVRSVTEATTRQQARAVYKKAGLSGRSDLAAFFLEDLLLPRGDNSRDPGTLPSPPTTPSSVPKGDAGTTSDIVHNDVDVLDAQRREDLSGKRGQGRAGRRRCSASCWTAAASACMSAFDFIEGRYDPHPGVTRRVNR